VCNRLWFALGVPWADGGRREAQLPAASAFPSMGGENSSFGMDQVYDWFFCASRHVAVISQKGSRRGGVVTSSVDVV